jgi:hypothetical protein
VSRIDTEGTACSASDSISFARNESESRNQRFLTIGEGRRDCLLSSTSRDAHHAARFTVFFADKFFSETSLSEKHSRILMRSSSAAGPSSFLS